MIRIAPCFRASVARVRVRPALCLALSMWFCAPPTASARQVLDRVIAVVGGAALTETDVRAAIGLGIIEVPDGPNRLVEGARAMIDRRLILLEVTRFPAPPPADADIDEQMKTMRANAGDELAALMQSTGVDDDRLRELARETLSIQAYVNQRFGTTAQASLQDAREYYETHPAEFTRDGVLAPFEQVETAARAAASNERRRASIAQWIDDLRARGEVIDVRRQ